METNLSKLIKIIYEQKIRELPQIHFKHILSKFNKELEEKFFDDDDDDYNNNSLVLVRTTFILSAILISIFGILDIWIVPLSKNYAWLIRFVFIIPSIIIFLLLTIFPFLKRIMQIALSISSVLVALDYAIMITVLHKSE